MKYYGITLQGTYHKKIDLVCQDAHYIKKVNDNFIIASVADGLGSQEHSDIASEIASRVSVQFCKDNIDESKADEEILIIIKNAFKESLKSISDFVKEKQDDISQYDTTLSLVVYINNKVYFGQSGDSGIMVLKQDGLYKGITTQQRDENGYVYPLCFGEEKWEFGIEENVASVLLATDGVYELLYPSLLFGEEKDIYIALAQFFMDKDSLRFGEISDEEVENNKKQFLESLTDAQINDDKTIVVLLNSKLECQKQDDSYYAIPNWTELKKKKEEEFRRKAYPHLFGEKAKQDVN